MVCTCRCFILLAFLSCSAWSAFRGASRVRRPTSDAFRPGVKPGKVPSSSVKLPQAAPPTTGTDRLQKVIAMAGLGSRRSAETMILDGRVSLNGKVVNSVGVKMKINQDVLTVDGKRVVVPDAKHTHWVAVNKPKSVLTTMRDELNRDTILNLVPQASELRLVPVGGLDRDDTGLMILTNELGWIHKLTHPSFPHVHRYEATIEGVLSIDTLESLNDAESSAMEDFSVRSVELVDVDPKQRTSRVSILLDQRGPQQLEEFIERLGCALVSLRRVEFAGVKLKGLKRGEWRELTDSEVLALKATVGQIGNT